MSEEIYFNLVPWTFIKFLLWARHWAYKSKYGSQRRQATPCKTTVKGAGNPTVYGLENLTKEAWDFKRERGRES